MFMSGGVALVKARYTWDGFTFWYSYWLGGEEIEGWTELVGDQIDNFEKTTRARSCYLVLDLDAKGDTIAVDLYLNEDDAIERATKRMKGIY